MNYNIALMEGVKDVGINTFIWMILSKLVQYYVKMYLLLLK